MMYVLNISKKMTTTRKTEAKLNSGTIEILLEMSPNK